MLPRTVRHEPWPATGRLVLTLPSDLFEALRESARANLRDPKREALRILRDGLQREQTSR